MRKTSNWRKTAGKTGFILTVLFFCMFLVTGNRAEAASEKGRALKAYNEMLSSKSRIEEIVYNEMDNYMMNTTSFSIAYIDNNNVPELILHIYDTQYVLTYKGGKVKLLGSWLLQADSPNFAYYRKKGVFRVSDFIDGYEDQRYCTLKGGKSSEFAVKHLNNKKVTGYSNGNYKSISASAFNNLVRKKTGGRSITEIRTYRKNTAANRRRYLK